MTMVDKVCPVVREDLRKIYFSKKIKEMVCLFVCLCVRGVSACVFSHICITPPESYCEGPTRSPHIFGMWRLDLVVKMGKNTVQEMVASYKNISLIYLQGGLSGIDPKTCPHKINKH